jgi:hypothetical protein
MLPETILYQVLAIARDDDRFITIVSGFFIQGNRPDMILQAARNRVSVKI